MKEQLELKDIACYLPYGLQVYTEYYDVIADVVGIKDNSYLCSYYTKSKGGEFDEICITKGKPILRPMSDLYKPCLPEGKIPIVELAKILGYNTKHEKINGNGLLINQLSSRFEEYFLYDPKDGMFKIYTWDDCCTSDYLQEGYSNPYLDTDFYDFLYSHHFNVHNLPTELFIDINTIQP